MKRTEASTRSVQPSAARLRARHIGALSGSPPKPLRGILASDYAAHPPRMPAEPRWAPRYLWYWLLDRWDSVRGKTDPED
jgi:hypothetical protein